MSHTILNRSTRNPMWVFEANYRLLRRLLPQLSSLQGRLVLGSRLSDELLTVTIDDQCRYTTMVTLKRAFSVDSEVMPDLTLSLRIYHDAAAVEVTAYQGCRRIPPRYAYKAGGRFQRDEKRQVNYLLHDLLRHALKLDYHPL